MNSSNDVGDHRDHPTEATDAPPPGDSPS
jgi:hypothetical protein